MNSSLYEERLTREKNVTALSHNTVFMGVQQLAMLSVHERVFVRNHVLLIAIRFEEGFCPGDVIEPNLRDTVKVGGSNASPVL